MSNKERAGDGTKPCGTPLLICLEEQSVSTTAVINHPERKIEMKLKREGDGIYRTVSWKLKNSCHTIRKAFDMSETIAKVLLKPSKK